ncbi:serine protease [Streptomyces mirabilis]|nr:serine protease [Streptomyces mirabilis]
MTAQDPRRGLDPVRVAEVMVRPPAGRGPGRRGSGYRVGPWWVLTAAHVVRDAGTGATDVRFEADRADEWTVAARVVLASERADVALLELDGSAPHGVHAAVTEPPSYGAVPDADLVLPCSAMGFPRFKLREDRMRRLDDGSASQYRDSCHATGMTSVLSNRREGTLELAVTPPESDAEPDRSPWEGMSGAAVWHDDAIVGLVSAHHRTDGLGRLAAVRVDRWYEQLTRSELALLHECAGLPASAHELPASRPRRPPPRSGHPGRPARRPAAARTRRSGGRVDGTAHGERPHHPGPGPGQHQPGRRGHESEDTGTETGRVRNPADLPSLPGDPGPTPRSDTVDGGRLRRGGPYGRRGGGVVPAPPSSR